MLVCTVCSHPERQAIDKLLLEGGTVRDVAGRHDLSKTAVGRHRGHLGKDLLARDRERAISALEHGTWLVGKLRALAERCEPHGEQFLRTADALTRALGVYGKLTGEIRPGNVQVAVQVNQAPVSLEQVEEKAARLLRERGWTVLEPEREVATSGPGLD